MRKINKETIRKINEIAQDDFHRAQAMLEGINIVLDTKYGWLNKRIVFFDEPDAPTCIKYRHAHDAYVYAE